MQEQTAWVENAGVENTAATKYGKPSEGNTLKYETKYQLTLGHQHITIDSVSDVSRVTRGLAIRRTKKRVNLTNDKRIKMSSQRFDSHAYTRLQFLRAVSHASAQRRC